MSGNSTNGTSPAIPALPPSLDLPPHLSAQKYFFVCTLTVLAWDTLVLTPRSYKLGRQPGWPALKWMYYFLQVWVLSDFIVTGVMFFSTTVDVDTTCKAFWPYEPICTAILVGVASAVHVIRISAIYDKDNRVRSLLGGLFAVQAIVTAICCGFYRSVHLEQGQGCIAGPRNNASWVGIYWLAPTLLYTTTFVLATMRSLQTLQAKPMTYWRLMLRDGLNLYGAIMIVNLANMFFYFLMTPTDPTDPIKTIVSSMAAVLTATMSMRIILGVRGSLAGGGAFAGASAASSSAMGSGSGSGSGRRGQTHTFTLGDMRDAASVPAAPKESVVAANWEADKNSVGEEAKGVLPDGVEVPGLTHGPVGVQVTVDRQVEYDEGFNKGRK
ncbi:hypothetical protein CONPUDRAFT_124492 [Coniophora puteana RWD-64-598 SS2]|uniref:Transmembrane protein n=1 Tax=Coniophora puteana (strain RWD-64-598) TaxID=741705 RepID=A0A5M3MQC7_CONPW|nr:uncharacterized protein CONPUDRAFT_124492 [Coniophora puteana RWD-64-598 SS2]EIW81382.1 hypothetical protein CONPUDRAFT_124492 [Coniophora puteana RWD-64-598 SS2]